MTKREIASNTMRILSALYSWVGVSDRQMMGLHRLTGLPMCDIEEIFEEADEAWFKKYKTRSKSKNDWGGPL